MRLDHIAYRVSNRDKAAEFFINAFNYSISDEFKIDFYDGTCANCYALLPSENSKNTKLYTYCDPLYSKEYHMAPEIFVSEGTKGSIVDRWVKERGGVGGIHHMAYMVDSVEETMVEWKKNNYCGFTTDKPIVSSDLTQCFTEPHPLTGVIYEFIERKDKGFNIDNVRKLMLSTE
ncbi:hypothetical protein N9W84_00765 [bacterium]|nr:hypothetical protein [bacterium]